MLKKKHDNQKAIDEDTKITERVVKFVDDPKNSSALAMIHEMSNKAKERGKSPTQSRRVRFMAADDDDKTNKKDSKIKFARRSGHYATVKHKKLDLINNNAKNDENIEKKTSGKKEYVWDKSINRLVEKDDIPNEIKVKVEEKTVKQEKIETHPKRQFKKESLPQKDKNEKSEIIEKLKQYRKDKQSDINNKKRIAIKVPKGNEKYSEIVYEKKVVKDGEEDIDDFEKEIQGSKNAKVYKKIVKNEPGSRVIITKRVIEENVESENNLKFDDNSSDEEDIRKELRKLRINPSDITKGNVKVKVITEEYDENGNKVYSKEVTTNKLPKGLKGNDEIMDEFEKFEEEFDE